MGKIKHNKTILIIVLMIFAVTACCVVVYNLSISSDNILTSKEQSEQSQNIESKETVKENNKDKSENAKETENKKIKKETNQVKEKNYGKSQDVSSTHKSDNTEKSSKITDKKTYDSNSTSKIDESSTSVHEHSWSQQKTGTRQVWITEEDYLPTVCNACLKELDEIEAAEGWKAHSMKHIENGDKGAGGYSQGILVGWKKRPCNKYITEEYGYIECETCGKTEIVWEVRR